MELQSAVGHEVGDVRHALALGGVGQVLAGLMVAGVTQVLIGHVGVTVEP